MEVKLVINDTDTMNLTVEPSNTILDIKKKLYKAINVMPVCHQRVTYKGKIIDDNDATLESCHIVNGSTIEVQRFDPYQGNRPQEVKLLLKLPDQSSPVSFLVNLDTDYVMHLKQKLAQANPGLRIGRLTLNQNGKIEMEDDTCLSQYFLLDGSKIDVSVDPSSPPSSSSPSKRKASQLSSSSSSSKRKTPETPSSSPSSKSTTHLPTSSSLCSQKMTVEVLTLSKKRLNIEVNASDNVEALKDELKRLQATEGFELSTDGYFFIHKRGILDEEKSFLSNNISDGDEIEILKELLVLETISISHN